MSTTIIEPLFRINELPENEKDDEGLRRWCVEQIIKLHGEAGYPVSKLNEYTEQLFQYIRNGVLSPKPTGEIKPNK